MHFGLGLFAGSLLGFLGLLHVYWAFRGSEKIGAAIPTNEKNEPLFIPGMGSTLVIGLGLLGLGGLAMQNALAGPLPFWSRALLLTFGGIFVLRSIGEFRYVGFFKSKRGTRFAYWDTRLFSPVSLVLGISLFLAAY